MISDHFPDDDCMLPATGRVEAVGGEAAPDRAVSELKAIVAFMVGNCRKTDNRDLIEWKIRQRIDALCAEPSPEPQRASAGLVARVAEIADEVEAKMPESTAAEMLVAGLREALAAEQAREPDGRDAEAQRQADLIDHARREAALLERAEQAESAYAEADAERQIAQDALWAYGEQVEALRKCAERVVNAQKQIEAQGETYPPIEYDIKQLRDAVRDLAALPTEIAEAESQPEGEAESPAKLATQRAIEADLADDEGEARESDDVLPIGAPDSAKREALRRGLLPFLCCQGNDPDCYGPSGCLLRALEGAKGEAREGDAVLRELVEEVEAADYPVSLVARVVAELAKRALAKEGK